MVETKEAILVEKIPWYLHKIVWFNFIVFIASLAQAISGHEIIKAEFQVSILAVINMIIFSLTKRKVV